MENKPNDLNIEENNLLLLINDVRYGEITIKVKNGVPVMASVIRTDYKLDK